MALGVGAGIARGLRCDRIRGLGLRLVGACCRGRGCRPGTAGGPGPAGDASPPSG